jgi:hypothetical protein
MAGSTLPGPGPGGRDRAEMVDEPHRGAAVALPRQYRQGRAKVTEAAGRADDGKEGADDPQPCSAALDTSRGGHAGDRDAHPSEVFEQDHARETGNIGLDQVELTARVAHVRVERDDGKRACDGLRAAAPVPRSGCAQ